MAYELPLHIRYDDLKQEHDGLLQDFDELDTAYTELSNKNAQQAETMRQMTETMSEQAHAIERLQAEAQEAHQATLPYIAGGSEYTRHGGLIRAITEIGDSKNKLENSLKEQIKKRKKLEAENARLQKLVHDSKGYERMMLDGSDHAGVPADSTAEAVGEGEPQQVYTFLKPFDVEYHEIKGHIKHVGFHGNHHICIYTISEDAPQFVREAAITVEEAEAVE